MKLGARLETLDRHRSMRQRRIQISTDKDDTAVNGDQRAWSHGA